MTTDIAAFLSSLSAEELSSLAKQASATRKSAVAAEKAEKARIKAERDELYVLALGDVLPLLGDEDYRDGVDSPSGWAGWARNGIEVVGDDGRAYRVNLTMTDVEATAANKAAIKAAADEQ